MRNHKGYIFATYALASCKNSHTSHETNPADLFLHWRLLTYLNLFVWLEGALEDSVIDFPISLHWCIRQPFANHCDHCAMFISTTSHHQSSSIISTIISYLPTTGSQWPLFLSPELRSKRNRCEAAGGRSGSLQWYPLTNPCIDHAF